MYLTATTRERASGEESRGRSADDHDLPGVLTDRVLILIFMHGSRLYLSRQQLGTRDTRVTPS